MFLQLDLHHSWSTVEEEEEGEEGRQEASCLLGSSSYPPACSWEHWVQGWGFEGRVGPTQTSLVRRSRTIVCAIECQGTTRSNGQAGDSRCCQLITPLSGKDSVFPLPAHTFLLGGRKCSWQCCRQCCPCFSTSPVPSHGGQARCQALGREEQGVHPWGAAYPCCTLPAPGILLGTDPVPVGHGRVWCVPHWHPSDKHPRHCSSATHSWLPSPSQLLCPMFISCHPVRDPGLARESQAGAGDTLPVG